MDNRIIWCVQLYMDYTHSQIIQIDGVRIWVLQLYIGNP